MNFELLDPVRYVVADIMEISPDAVSLESSNLTLEGWDSLRHLKLVAALSETFEIEIDDDDVEACLEVQAIVQLLSRKLDTAAA